MRTVFLAISLLVLLTVAGCRPAATPLPMGPSPLTSPASPVAATSMPQVLPTVTPLSSPVKTIAAGTSGIHVTATIGPTCPGPQRPGQVCTRPYEGSFVVNDSRGVEVGIYTTDQNGQATVDLPPGAYTVTPKIEGRFPAGPPTAVTVPAGEYVEANLELDTGIR